MNLFADIGRAIAIHSWRHQGAAFKAMQGLAQMIIDAADLPPRGMQREAHSHAERIARWAA